jgi:hypothetical protein
LWGGEAAGGADRTLIYRYDPAVDLLVAVPAAERKVGYIYRRFDDRRNRWVWSFYEGPGEFSFALGEGTIQPGQRLDLRLEAEQVEATLEKVAPEMSEAMKELGDFGGRVYVRLNRDDRWEVYGPFGVPHAYDAESGHRWENHGGQYVPVTHTTGYRWVVRDGRYVPATASAHCPCACGVP